MIKTVIVSLIMCLVEFFVIVAASPMAKPSIVLRFLPEDIREAAKDHPEPAKWKQLLAHGLLGIAGIKKMLDILYLGDIMVIGN